MKLIKSSVEIIKIKPKDILIDKETTKEELINMIYQQIEIAGRTCYKSEDKITETSAKEFTERMIKSGHTAMLEQGTVYLKCPISLYYVECGEREEVENSLGDYLDNPYSRGEEVWDSDKSEKGCCYVTTNYRVLVENNWLRDLQYICRPTEYHDKRTMVRFICDRGISHELVRHRVFSFAQESTRYCNYSKDKFNRELTFIIPSWFKELKEGTLEDIIKVYGQYDDNNHLTNLEKCKKINRYYSADNYENDWVSSMLDAEITYMGLTSETMQNNILHKAWLPQQARSVLPNSLKTEVIMTGFNSDWNKFFKLRDDKHAHPDMQVLAHKLHEDFKRNDL